MHITDRLNPREYYWVCNCNPNKHVARMDKDDIIIKCNHCKETATAKELKDHYEATKTAMREPGHKPDGWTGTGINRVWRTE